MLSLFKWDRPGQCQGSLETVWKHQPATPKKEYTVVSKLNSFSKNRNVTDLIKDTRAISVQLQKNVCELADDEMRKNRKTLNAGPSNLKCVIIRKKEKNITE